MTTLDADRDLGADLLALLKRLNVCSGEFKARQYDHEVKGLSVLKPYIGVQRNVLGDATVSMVEQLGEDGVYTLCCDRVRITRILCGCS